MFKTTKQLQTFILWAKKQGIKEVHVGKTVVVFSDYALAAEVIDTPDPIYAPKPATEERNTSRTLLDEPGEDPDDEDALLYHSAQ